MDDYRKKLLELIKASGTDLKTASLKIDRNHAYLHQFIYRGTPIHLDELDRAKLADFLKISEDEIIPAEKLKITRNKKNTNVYIPVIGTVEGGGNIKIHSIDDMPNCAGLSDAEHLETNCDVIEAPEGAYPVNVGCVVVRGNSMYPRYKDGEYLLFRRTGDFTDACIGEDCIIELSNGQHMVKVVRRGSIKERYNLESYNEPPIENAQIKWAAPIEGTQKRRKWN